MAKLAAKPENGKASIEAFFTSKGGDLYAILPRWPGRQFTVKDYEGAKPRSVTLLGVAAPLDFKFSAGAVTVELPELPEELLAEPAWVLKLSR
ncbi:MAG: alpha-L-fucosidase C-terminal domain-containing protein [Bryobacteraceae bacterium]